MTPMVFDLDGRQLLKDLETLAGFGAIPDGGVSRVAYSAADQAARTWVEGQLNDLGLAVRRDFAGNTIARYRGLEDLPTLAAGSHTDTVPAGGIYDGALGVLAALACVRTLVAARVRLRHPLEVINFAAEEATMATATLGSLAMCGPWDPALIDRPAWDSRPTRLHLQAAGIDVESMALARRRSEEFAAYLELHIEQGDVLDNAHTPMGVVEGIVGICRYLVTFHGEANHAGTTAMQRRRDALVTAAPYIQQVRTIAIERGIVGTIGKVDVEPGAPNVIPGRVTLYVEIRGLDERVLLAAEEDLARAAGALGGELERVSTKSPVRSHPAVMAALTRACGRLGLDHVVMPSGAGHDAMNMASLCPMAMLFVPSQGGVSHSPREWTAAEACVDGARALLESLLELDETLDS